MFFKKKSSKEKQLACASGAEFVGAFLLSMLVSTSVLLPMGIPTPVIAGLTLGLIVYTLGPISGAHANPAITLALFSLDKVDSVRTLKYIIAQICGGILTLIVARYGFGMPIATPEIFSFSWQIFFGELIGTAILGFAVAAVVMKKVSDGASGVTIGGALLLGATFAGPLSTGVLNPAVAIGVGAITLVYLVTPIVGACLGMWIYRSLAS